MYTDWVNQQPQRGVAHTAGAQGPQKGVFDPDQGQIAPRRQGLPPIGRGALAPDQNTI